MAKRRKRKSRKALKRAETLARAHPLVRADLAAALWSARQPKLAALAPLAELADEPPLLALSLLVAAAGAARRDARMARTGGRMLAALAAAVAAKTLGKRVVGRTRPKRLIKRGEHRIRLGGPHTRPWNAFPSGHAAGAVAIARAVGRDYPALAVPSLVLAGLTATLKAPAQDHWPGDLLAGAALGWAAEAMTGALWD